MRPFPLIALSCAALVLNLLAFMTVAAVLPALKAEWGMNNTQAGWLGGVFFGGYIAAVPVLVSITDRVSPKRVFLASSALGVIAALGFAWLADGLWSGLLFRFLTGVSVAGTYMPGAKALADRLEEPHRTRAVTYYTSVFALGSGISIWVGGESADWLGWRWPFVIAGFGHALGLLLGALVLPQGSTASVRGGRHALDVRPVFRNRPAMTYVLAYAGHGWEVFANRVWVVSFLVFAETRYGQGGLFASPVLLGSLVAFIGVPVSMAFGELAARRDRRRALVAVMLVSAVVGVVFGFSAGWPPWIVAALALLYGMTTYADTGALSAATVSVAVPEQRGATMAVHAFIGFLGGLAGPVAVGLALDLAGGENDPVAWGVAYLVMTLGSVFAATVLLREIKRSAPT